MHRIDEPHPFSLETASLHYAEDRPARAKHLKLEIDLDFAKKSIRGVVTHTLEAVRSLDRLSFHAIDLEISKVELNGKAIDFDAASARDLHAIFPRTIKPGTSFTIRITYSGEPQRGLYFVGDEQVWTQGQDIDSRFYFPCLDTPAQKATSEVIATFPQNLTALSNGKLVSDTVKGARRTMHYALASPHSPYLVTLVVGRFETHEQKVGQTTVRTMFPPGRKEDALRCTQNTPKMIQLFENLTGRAYPWGDYAQVFVSEFIFGGMENTSATTLTDTVLHDKRAHLDYSAEFLIAHELAHQWFGDLLTTRDWPHGWLNEGFATYSEILWAESSDGLDEADHVRKGDLETYLHEVSDRYARPIVARKFDAPIDLFDRHLYEKGGLVLHELRRRLGDDDFYASIRAYVKAHEHDAVETVDLSRAIERTTGRNVDQFFDEYVFRAGHPKLKTQLTWDAAKKAVKLTVKQAQEGEAYDLTLPVQIVIGGKATAHALAIHEKETVFFLAAPREPEQVLIDAHRDLLATIDTDKPMGWWRNEVKGASVARARTDAAAALGKDTAKATVDALTAALLDEKAFWGSRAASAKSLGTIRTPAARESLLTSLKVKHPKVRRAVVAALGQFRDDAKVGEVLTALAKKGDPSAFVEGEIARALGRLKADGAFATLESMMGRPAFQDAIRSGALDGFAELRDPRGWGRALAALEPGQPVFGRRAAVVALAKLAETAEKKSETVDRIGQLFRDENFRVRLAAIDAAATLGDDRLLGPLGSTPFLDGREQRMAREAMRSLRSKTPGREVQALRGDLEKLKGELRALQDKVSTAKR